MKLFAWQPGGHGELSFFVCADNEVAARAALDREIARRIALDEFDDGSYGWPESAKYLDTDYYVLTVAEPGQVVFNYND